MDDLLTRNPPVSASSSSTSSVPGGMEHTTIIKKLDELKTVINDGFSKMSMKLNEMGLKQSGGARKKRRHTVKNKKIR